MQRTSIIMNNGGLRQNRGLKERKVEFGSRYLRAVDCLQLQS